MAKSIIGTKKSRGRPKTTGIGMQIGMRWHVAEIEKIDDWIEDQKVSYTRPEAIRRLVEIGLQSDGKGKRKPTAKAKASARAAELAAGVIDSRMAADATSEEKATRKDRLVKGPSTFREVRKDRSK
jgi:hypothetical protein